MRRSLARYRPADTIAHSRAAAAAAAEARAGELGPDAQRAAAERAGPDPGVVQAWWGFAAQCVLADLRRVHSPSRFFCRAHC